MRCADAHLRLAELYARLQALGRHPLPPQCWGGWGGRPSAQPTLDDDWLELAEELQPLWQEHEHCWRAEQRVRHTPSEY